MNRSPASPDRAAARSVWSWTKKVTAGLIASVVVGSAAIVAPAAAVAATTTDDILPFNAAEVDRYVEVTQFGTDVVGSDAARTGYDVRMSGGTVIYTAERGSNTPGSGSVAIRTWEGPGKADYTDLVLNSPTTARGFGFSVDVDEAAGIAVVGARFSQEVYVYTRTADVWSPTPTRITPAPDARVNEVRSFGEAVSLSDSYVVVGAPNSRVDGKANAGAAYAVPVTSATAGDSTAFALLLPAAEVAADDVYGQIVASRGSTAIVSAPQHEATAADGDDYQVGQISSWDLASTTVNFSVTPDVNQAQVAFPPALEGGSWAGLGRSITIAADGRIIAGSPSEVTYVGTEPGDIATDTTTTQGAVYVYNADGSLAGKSTSALPHQYYFGASLDYNEDTSELFIASLNLDGTPNQGKVQVFDLAAPATTTPSKPLVTNEGEETFFGTLGILGGSVQAATKTDSAGKLHNRAVVSANGNVYVFESIDAVTLNKTTSLSPGNASPSANDGRNVADYTITVKNTTGVPLTDFTVTDDLVNVIDDADVTGVSASTGTAALTGETITWTGDLAVDEEITITYTATVKEQVVADDTDVQSFTEPVAALVNTVSTSREVGGETQPVPSVRDEADAADRSKWTDGVVVTTPIDGALKLSKSAADADGNGSAKPGETVSYTVTATNVGGLPISGATVADDLADVLTYASAPQNITVSFVDRDGTDLSAATPVFTSPNLAWTGDFPAGAVLTITYDVTVKAAADIYPLAGGESLVNKVSSPENVDPDGPGTSTPLEDELILAKSSAPATGEVVEPGDEITYTLTLTNKDQNVAKTNVTVTDDLSAVLPFAELISGPDQGATVGGNLLTWTGDLAAGATTVITYTVRVLNTAPDGQVIRNLANSTSVRENPPATEHEVENPRGQVELTKTSDPVSGALVKPGDTITYTVTAHNDTAMDMPDVMIEDIVSGPANVVASSLPSGATVSGDTITWTGTVAAGESVALIYEVTVNSDATAPAVVGNVVTSPDMSNDPSNPPSTEHPVRTIELVKTSTPDNGATVASGDTITYSISATNPSTVEFADVTITDDLSGVLNNAELITPLAEGTFDSTTNTISWTGDLAAGETKTLTYAVVVNAVVEPEGAVLRNVVSSPDSPTTPGTEHPTDNPRGTVTLAKTADPASGSLVRPGDTIQYTVTVTNDTPRVIRDVRVVDDVTNVINNATIDTSTLPAGMTLAGNELVWIGDVPGGGAVVLTYAATVDADALAPAVIRNVVTSSDMSNDPGDPPSTEHPVGTVVLSKASDPASGTAVKAGDVVNYTVSVQNPATVDITGVTVSDDLSDVLDDATLTAGPSSGAVINAGILSWTGDVAAGETVQITYTVQVNANAVSGSLRNVVTSPDSPDSPVTENPIGSIGIAKSVSVPDDVAANRGDEVTYTLTLTNTSGADVLGTAINDELADVLDNAEFVAGSIIVTGGGLASLNGTMLTWEGDVVRGSTVTITYRVTVHDDAPVGQVLRNVVTSPHSPDEPETNTPVGVVKLAKTSSVAPAGPVKPGSQVTYVIEIMNPSAVSVNEVEVNDNLNDVLAHAAVTTEPTATSGTVQRSAGALRWNGDVPANGTVTITYVVKVNDTVTAPAVLRNVVTSPDSPDEPSTTDPIGSLELTKITDVPAGSVVRLGQEVVYTIGILNNSAAAITGTSVTDDLSDVLDNADLIDGPTVIAGGGTASVTGSVMTWTGDVPQGGTVQVQYTVKVKSTVSGVESLRNVVTSPDSPSTPETENPIGSVELAKTSAPATGAGVKRGDEVTYTVAVRNTSGVDLTAVSATDDLSGVLPYADLVGTAEVITGTGDVTVDAAAQTLTWSGDIAASQLVEIRYTVLVKADASSGDMLRNLVSSPDSPNESETEHPVTTVELTKSADPASGSTVRPGDSVVYTVTVRNSTDTDATEVSVSDDVSDVIDDATINPASVTVSDGSTATLTGSTISWVGTVPADGTVTITYEAVVNDDALAPAVLRNVVTSPHSPNEPETENPVGSLILSKSNDKGDNTVVTPGEKVTYTVTIRNPGSGEVSNTSVTDDLSEVLNSATWNDDATATSGTVERNGNEMVWTGSVPANGTVTVTYSVTLADDAKAPAVMKNRVFSPDSPNEPQVENPVGTIELDKTSTPASGTAVKPGETVTYSVVVANPANVDQVGVQVNDNLSDVLDNATVVGAPTVSDGSTAVIDGNVLRWNGTVPANSSVDIEYQVQVNDDAVAPATLRNLVTSPRSTDTPETENPVGTVVLSKTVDPSSGTSVKPGQDVAYTVTVRNPVNTPVANVTVTDDLSGVLGIASLATGPSATSGMATYDSGTQSLTWSGDLDANETVTITYAVTVNKDAKQGDWLRNVVVSPDSPNNPSTENPVGEVTTAKRLRDSDGNVIPSGTIVAPGQELTYELTASNSLTTAQRISLRDDLSDVLDDATLVVSPEASWNDPAAVPQAVFDNPVLTWDEELPAGATVTIRYTVKTDPQSDGARVLSNTLEVNGEEGPGTENPVGTLELAKASNPASGTAVKRGSLVTYTVTALNTSDVAIVGAEISDDLSDVLDDAKLEGKIVVSDGSEANVTGNALNWKGDVPANSSISITYTVRVDADAVFPAVLRNVVTSPYSPDHPETENPVGSVELLKSSAPEAGTAVKPGSVVEYSVIVRNTTAATIDGVSVTDDLADVVDNATLDQSSVRVSDGSSAIVTEDRIVWNGSVPASSEIVITYQVTVNEDAVAPQILRNVVASPDSPDEPETVNPVGTLRLAKASVPGSGSAVKPGDFVDYTVTITNDASAPVLAATVADDLSDVLDDAALVGEPQTSAGSAAVVDTQLVWTGDVPARSSVTISYRVQVNPEAVAPATLRNVVTSPESPNKPETENPVATVVLGKSSNPTSGTAVKPGDVVSYTITVTNPGLVDLNNVYVEDNLSDVLDNAALSGDPEVSDGSRAQLNGQSLSWTGTVPAGETISITYTVVVSANAVAPQTLRNLVTSPHSPDSPETENPVGTVNLTKTSSPATGTAVDRGDKVTYTITVSNPTPYELRDVVFTDDLSDVLDDADLVEGPEVVGGDGVATIEGSRLDWAGTVAANGTVQVRYVVQVKATAVAPATLNNVVVSPHSPDQPETENPVKPLAPGESLPSTGVAIGIYPVLGLLAVLVGAAVLVTRKRRHGEEAEVA